MNSRSAEISQFILGNVEASPDNIAFLVADKFGISRQMAHKYVVKEVKSNRLIKVGKTSSTRYFLAGGKHIEFLLKIEPGLGEDVAWTKYVKPVLINFPSNIYQICHHGFTEMFNNAIDHSEGKFIHTTVDIEENSIVIKIVDDGIGIFEKIKKALKLETYREALLHLSKGKFTTDPKNHTGQGIFFTSRMCDEFDLLSNGLIYSFENDEWLFSKEKEVEINKGTFVKMVVSLNSKKTPKEVFDKFTNEEMGFDKSIVAVALSNDPNDPHVSRSQAKRLLMGLEKFKTVILDFKNVQSVGQAFVDEVFRVYQNEHPHIKIIWANANAEVESMIKTGLANK